MAVLTIGMIIKNEIKYIEKTLEALAPLREAVSCKLVIVDTGSNDGSDKVAEKYADDFRRFEWCDDFSAARNKTLEGIDSEWYIYIDADETAEDIKPLSDFFTSGEYKKYNSAAIVIKNILSGISSNEFRPIRLCRVVPGLAFAGVIHETLVGDKGVIKYTDALFNHYGYYTANRNERQAKELRNSLILKKKLAETPDNPNVWFQYAETCFIFDPGEAERSWKKAFDLSFAPIAAPIFKYGVLARMEMFYTSKEDFDKTIELTRLFDKTLSEEKGVKSPIYPEIENAFYTGVAYSCLDETEKCADAFIHYRALMADFRAGKFDPEDNQYYPIVNATDDSFIDATEELARCFVKLGRFDEANALLIEIGTIGRADIAFDVMVGRDDYGFIKSLAESAPDETAVLYKRYFSRFKTETKAAAAAREAFSDNKKYARETATVEAFVSGKLDMSKLTLAEQLDLINFFGTTSDKVRRAVIKTVTEDYISKVYLIKDPIHYAEVLKMV
ncbi:MAG: glycosyltransferase [Ruminococcus sp.]|jgi:glycosyltransferase involved in cell wall biosynthesis|nr:glycosyltransferase [Ruminococcus sp.]